MPRPFLIAALTALCAIGQPIPAAAAPAIVVDVRSGAVLAHEDAFKRWYPASLTKLMTAYLALRMVRSGKMTMKSPVRISAAAAAEPPSKMGYPAGSVLTLDNALKMVMVKSANDVAVAIGEAIAGSELAFVEQMNDEAARLGMADTRFANPHGLPDPGQHTTARDMALLAVALRREFPEYGALFALEAIDTGQRVLRNFNILIGRFAGADGMKTGFVCASGFNLAASATRADRTLVAIVLGAASQQQRAERAADLLAAGFETAVAGREPLAALAPYGENRNEVANMRPVVCTRAARQNRYDGRDVDGQMVFRSPHLAPMNRAPVAAPVRLGGATGPVAPQARDDTIPLPSPRPADAPVFAAAEPAITAEPTAKAAAAEPETGSLGGKPAPGVPVPTPRPDVSP